MNASEKDLQGLSENGLLRNEQFRQLINHIPGAIYRCSGDQWLSLEFFSEEIINLSGYPMSYFLSNRKDGYLSIVHPDDREGLLKQMRFAIANKEKFHFEYRIIRNDEEVRWVSERGQGVYDEENHVSYVDGCIFDITERKNTESALEKSEDEIKNLTSTRRRSVKQQEELLQRLTLATDSAEIGIWEIDLVTNKVIWDERMFRIYGYPDGTDTSLYKIFNSAVHPEDAERMSGIIGDLIMGKTEVNGAVYRILLPDGVARYIESHAIIKRAEDGRPVSLIGTNRDVTEAVGVQEKIKAQNKMLRDIAFIQSHEVRRPLANILGIIEVLKNMQSFNELEIFHHLEDSARELDKEVRNIVNKTNSLDDETFR
jgi:two-component system NtrC family sensor kinase